MNPYTPPSREPEAETGRPAGMGKILGKRSGRWITVAFHFCVIFGTALAASLVASMFVPDGRFDGLSDGRTGHNAQVGIGALTAMVACPIFAGFRHWGLMNYFIAAVMAFGFFFGNFGFGIPLAAFSTAILHGTKRLVFMLAYFRSPPPAETEEGGPGENESEDLDSREDVK